jgi:hypothetical protein
VACASSVVFIEVDQSGNGYHTKIQDAKEQLSPNFHSNSSRGV